MKVAGRFYLGNEKGRAFLADVVSRQKKAAALREECEKRGFHVPVFLIAGIASQCNLRCAGCYARACGGLNGSAANAGAGSAGDLGAAEWRKLFREAADTGVSFVLLAGGEPLTRRDVLTTAAEEKNLVFPVFTNGTLLDAPYLELFDNHRNLIPVISIEGDEKATDARRGNGTYAAAEKAFVALCERGILFGVSVTMTRENAATVTGRAFAEKLRDKGCGLIIYTEYVPVEPGTEHLALTETDRESLAREIDALKAALSDTVILSFPGDEQSMGGCLASGRGFFNINSKGDAEPCPFSPYSKHNVKDASLEEILRSSYFEKLRDIAAKADPHSGGCVLFRERAAVRAL